MPLAGSSLRGPQARCPRSPQNLSSRGLAALVLWIAPQCALARSAATERVRACLLDSRCDRLVVAAHRQGYAGSFENSLWAFRQNLGKETVVMELDVRETWDASLILMHDKTVDRTTTGNGRVGWMSLDQIRRLRLKGLDEPPPTLEEVLALSRGRFYLIIDIKEAPIEKVWGLVERYGMAREVILQLDRSSEYNELNKLLQEGKEILFMARLRQGMSAGVLMDSFSRMPRFLHIDEETLTPETLREIRTRNAKPYLHFPAAGSHQELRQAGLERLRLGVHFFDHDQPEKVYEALPDWR